MSEQTSTTGQIDKEQGRGGPGHHRCGDKERHCRRGRCFGKVLMVLAVFGLGFFSGQAYSCGYGPFPGDRAGFIEGKPVDTERVGKFADKRLQRMLDQVNADAAQKARAKEIVQASIVKGKPLAEKMRDNHRQIGKLMAAATLDKAAIEALRVEQMQLADETSKLVTQTMEQVAEILTPEQRVQMAEQMQRHRGWMHRG